MASTLNNPHKTFEWGIGMTTEEIDKEWPDQEFNYTDKDGMSHNSPHEWFWTSVLGFCGCYSENIFLLSLSILSNLYKAKKENGSWYYDYKDKSEDYCGIQELLLHVFDNKKIAEHGSSVRGCWLTDYGFEVAKTVFETRNPNNHTT